MENNCILENDGKSSEIKTGDSIYKTIFQNTHNLLILIDYEFKVIEVNQRASSWLGYAPLALAGTGFYDLPFLKSQGGIFSGKPMLELLKDGALEITINSVDGSIYPALASLSNPSEGLVLISLSDITDTKKSEKLILERERKYRYVIDSLKEVIFRTDNDDNWIFLNPAWEEITGFKIEDSLGKKSIDYVHAQDKARINDFVQSVRSGEIASGRLEIRYLTKNGGSKWIEMFAKLTREDFNAPSGLTGTLMDITERKLMERRIADSRDYLVNVIDSLPNPIYLVDSDHQFVLVNKEFCRFVDMKRQSILNLTVYDVFDNQTASMLFTAEAEILDKGGERVTELSFQTEEKSKKSFLVKFTYLRNSDGRLNVLAAMNDVSDQRYIHSQLLKLNELNGLIAEISSKLIQSPIEMIDEHIYESVSRLGAFLNVKRAFIYRIFPRTRLLRNLLSINYENNRAINDKPEDKKSYEFPELLKAIEGGNAVYMNKNSTRDELYNELMRLLPETDAESGFIAPFGHGTNLSGFLGIVLSNNLDYKIGDIARIIKITGEIIAASLANKEFETEIISAKELAETANKTKSLFLANISHEIRTPLNAILGFSELLRNRIDDPTNKEFISSIVLSGKSLLSLINDVLDLSKIESGKVELNYQPVNIRNVLNDIKKIFALKADEKSLELSVQINFQLPERFILDELRTRQILINLVGNAVKFTEKGSIKVKADFKKTSTSKADLFISVEDTGIGINKEKFENVFEPFIQIGANSMTKASGTGLGLTISRRLSEMMNAEIELESEINKGSKFTLVFKDAAIDGSEITREKNDSDLGVEFFNPLIMVAEDIESHRRLLAEQLRLLNINVLFADNGNIAIENAKRFSPDIILMDLKMPELDGLEAASEIRVKIPGKHIPIIAVTAFAMKDDKEKILEYCDSMISKPIQKNDLIEELKKYLPYRQTKIEKIEIPENTGVNFSKEHVKIISAKYLQTTKRLIEYPELDDIVKLSEDLRKDSELMEISELKIFADDLKQASDAFNIVKIIKLLKDFFEILK